MVYLYDRRQVLARGFSTEKALQQYLSKHPGADKSKHYVDGPLGGKERADKSREKAKEKREDSKLRRDLGGESKNHPGGSINWGYDPKNRSKSQKDKAESIVDEEINKKSR